MRAMMGYSDVDDHQLRSASGHRQTHSGPAKQHRQEHREHTVRVSTFPAGDYPLPEWYNGKIGKARSQGRKADHRFTGHLAEHMVQSGGADGPWGFEQAIVRAGHCFFRKMTPCAHWCVNVAILVMTMAGCFLGVIALIAWLLGKV